MLNKGQAFYCQDKACIDLTWIHPLAHHALKIFLNSPDKQIHLTN